MTDETAKKCEMALRQAEWSTCTREGGHRTYSCPACYRQAGRVHRDDCVIDLALAALRDETAEPPRPTTPEQKARDLLEHIDAVAVHLLESTELAELIASHERLLVAVDHFPWLGACREWWERYGKPAMDKAWKPDDA